MVAKKTHRSSKFTLHPRDLCWVLIILQSNSQPPQPLLLNPGFNVGLKPGKFHAFERGFWTTLIFWCLSHPKRKCDKKLKQGWSVVNHDHWTKLNLNLTRFLGLPWFTQRKWPILRVTWPISMLQTCPTPRRIVVRHDLASPPVASWMFKTRWVQGSI